MAPRGVLGRPVPGATDPDAGPPSEGTVHMIGPNLDAVTLTRGPHPDRSDGLCLLEAAALVAGEPHSDAPWCVSPVLRTMGIHLNDVLLDERRQQLAPLIPLLPGTRGDGRDRDRSLLALDWLIREFTPSWLAYGALEGHAETLRELPPIASLASATYAADLVRTAEGDAVAAGDAAWAGAGDGAWAAAGTAVCDAIRTSGEFAARAAAEAGAGDATWAAAADAARSAALAAAWAAVRDATWSAAWSAARDVTQAARHPARDGDRSATRVAARDAAWAAAGETAKLMLDPVAHRLQQSALAVFAAMAQPSAPPAAGPTAP